MHTSEAARHEWSGRLGARRRACCGFYLPGTPAKNPYRVFPSPGPSAGIVVQCLTVLDGTAIENDDRADRATDLGYLGKPWHPDTKTRR